MVEAVSEALSTEDGGSGIAGSAEDEAGEARSFSLLELLEVLFSVVSGTAIPGKRPSRFDDSLSTTTRLLAKPEPEPPDLLERPPLLAVVVVGVDEEVAGIVRDNA